MEKSSPKVIAITGTPGTGKSAIAKKLSLLLDYAYIDGSALAKKAYVGYDRLRRTHIAEPSLFTNEVLKVRDACRKKGMIVDSHLSHTLPRTAVKACVVLTSDLPPLEVRLKNKGFKKAKIRENLDAEIFDTILIEAKEQKHKIIKFDSTKPLKLLEKEIRILANRLKRLQ